MTPQAIVRNELVITRLRRNDLMTTLTCEANNSNLSEPVSTSISLELNRKLHYLLRQFIALLSLSLSLSLSLAETLSFRAVSLPLVLSTHLTERRTHLIDHWSRV